MRIGLYARVSTKEQAEKWSLPAQRRALIDYCERQGWAWELYEDAGISGETLDARPAMLRLLEDARAHRIDLALSVELERFSRSRSLFDWLIIKQAFREGGVRFGTLAQVYDPADEEDDFLSDLFGALSKREKAKLLARTKRGRIEAARAGHYLASRAPYGYRFASKGHLAVDDGQARVVRLVFALYVAGKTVYAVQEALLARGVPTPRGKRPRWGRDTIETMLANPLYVGRPYYNRTERRRVKVDGREVARVVPRPEGEWIPIPGGVPRLVSDATFAHAQDRLRRNPLESRRNRKRFYLLSGLLRCGTCGRSLVGYTPQGGSALYACTSRNRTNAPEPCGAPRVSARRLEAAVWAHLTDALTEPERVLADAARWRQMHLSERDEMLLRLDAVRAALARVPQERERVLTAHRKGWATEDEAETQLSALDGETRRQEEERTTLEARLSDQTATEAQAARLETLLARVGRRLARLTDAERYELAHAFIQRVIVHTTGTVEVATFVPVAAGYRRAVVAGKVLR